MTDEDANATRFAIIFLVGLWVSGFVIGFVCGLATFSSMMGDG